MYKLLLCTSVYVCVCVRVCVSEVYVSVGVCVCVQVYVPQPMIESQSCFLMFLSFYSPILTPELGQGDQNLRTLALTISIELSN